MVGPMPKAGPIGTNLARLRRQRGMTQEQVADAAGMGRTTIVTLETGTVTSVTTRTLERLATALGVEISALTETRSDESQIERELAEFVSSPWGKTLTPPATAEELDSLRGSGQGTWRTWDPNPETLHYLVLALRARRSRGRK